MKSRMITSRAATAAAIALALLLSACGGDDAAAGGDDTPGAVDDGAATTEVDDVEQTESDRTPEPTAPPEPTAAPEPTPTPEPEPTPEPATTATPEPAAPAAPITEGPNEPGRYTHPTIDGFALTLDAPMTVMANQDHILVMASDAMLADGAGAVAFLETLGIIPPSEVAVHQPHHPPVPDVMIDMPADLSVWLEAVPQIEVLDSDELTVAGMPARRWTIGIDPDAGPTFSDCGSPHCLGFVVNDQGGTYVLRSDELSAIYQFDAAPGVIGWAFAPDGDGIAAAAALFDQVLAGLSAT